MKYFIKSIFVLLLNIYVSSICLSQNETYSVLRIDSIILSPSTFSIDQENNIYILDSENNEMAKIGMSGNLMKKIGGLGSGQLNFDSPVSLSTSLGLNVFVADYYNNRIQRFNKNLEYIGTLYTKDDEREVNRFGFPSLIILDRFSNLFIYDNENKRILKFNIKNQVERILGSYEYNEAKINNPIKFETNFKDDIIVLEESRFVIFDNWGTFLRSVRLPQGYKAISFSMDQKYIYSVADDNLLLITNLDGKKLQSFNLKDYTVFSDKENTKDIKVLGEKMFILTSQRILIFEKEVVLKSLELEN